MELLKLEIKKAKITKSIISQVQEMSFKEFEDFEPLGWFIAKWKKRAYRYVLFQNPETFDIKKKPSLQYA